MPEILKQVLTILKQRELLFYLAIRELKIRYKYPFLGFLWMLLVPLSMVFIFKLVFSYIIKITVPGYSFFVFLMTALFPWNYFALTVTQATTSLVDNSNLIKKVYFPREIIPISILIGNLINFILTILLVIIILFFLKIKMTGLVLFLPILFFLQTLFMTGLILICSSLQTLYRDVKYIVEILVLLWFYLTPIFYPLSLIEDLSTHFLKFYMLNPLACIITLYRIILLPGFASTLPQGIGIDYLVNYTISICFTFFIFGLLIFKRYDARISDFV